MTPEEIAKLEKQVNDYIEKYNKEFEQALKRLAKKE